MRIGHVTIERPDWWTQAACLGQGTSDHFPRRGQSHDAAHATCDRCPVIDPCRAYAVADDTLVGIWGGTTEHQRDQLRSKQ